MAPKLRIGNCHLAAVVCFCIALTVDQPTEAHRQSDRLLSSPFSQQQQQLHHRTSRAAQSVAAISLAPNQVAQIKQQSSAGPVSPVHWHSYHQAHNNNIHQIGNNLNAQTNSHWMHGWPPPPPPSPLQITARQQVAAADSQSVANNGRQRVGRSMQLQTSDCKYDPLFIIASHQCPYLEDTLLCAREL